MSGLLAFCPRCRKETVFIEAGGYRKCSACGAQFEVTQAPFPLSASRGSEVMTVFQVLVRVVLILVALVAVGLAVLFAGCVVLLRGMH